MPTVTVTSLKHIYGRGTPFEKTAIHDISLEIPQGQFVGLIGHTGSGKSTLIQHLNGLLKPHEGQVFLDGADIHRSKEAVRNARFQVGLVFQYPEYQLFEETVFKDIAFGPGNMGLGPDEIRERVEEAAALTGVSDSLFNRSPLELSGGQKRRVAIAGVLAMRPGVLVLDEPTAGLDPAGRESLMENILNYHRGGDRTVILVTHNMESAAQVAQRLIVLSQGTVAMDGPPAEIFKEPEVLGQMGLSVPVPTALAMELRKRGVALPEAIYTTARLKEALLCVRRGEASC